jgi:hypothetical protein
VTCPYLIYKNKTNCENIRQKSTFMGFFDGLGYPHALASAFNRFFSRMHVFEPV